MEAKSQMAASTSRFGDWLRAERERRVMSRADLAARSGVSAMQIGNLEGGRTLKPRRATREKLLSVLDVDFLAPVAAEAEREIADDRLGQLIDFDPYNSRPSLRWQAFMSSMTYPTRPYTWARLKVHQSAIAFANTLRSPGSGDQPSIEPHTLRSRTRTFALRSDRFSFAF